jgi:hypothetical protein
MDEIKTSDISTQPKVEKPSENFDPDKRVGVKETETNIHVDDLSPKKDFDPDNRIEPVSKEVTEQDIVDYVNDLREHSEYPETIPEKSFGVDNIERRSPEENGKKRANFQGHGEGGRNNPEYKGNLRNEWEKLHGKPWPRYTEDNCPNIRNPGDCYDAHHIKPLSWGGESIASNITPMHADVHFDSKGVHDVNSPYARIDKKLGGNGND